MKLFGITFLEPKRQYGKGKRAVPPEALAEAMRLKGQGLPTVQVARRTGLNPRTVERNWRSQQSLPALLDNLGKEALHDDPELRRRAGAAQVLAPRGQALPLPSPSPSPPTPPALTRWEQRQLRQIVEFTFRQLREFQPEELVRYGRQYLHRAIFGEADLLDMVAWDAATEDPAFRKRVADLALEKLEADVDAAVYKLRGPRHRPSTDGDRLVQAFKRQAKGQQARETAIIKTIGASVGPGGALTVLLGGAVNQPPAGRHFALPAGESKGDAVGATREANTRRAKHPSGGGSNPVVNGPDVPELDLAHGGSR